MISSENQKEFEESGVVCLRNIFSEEWVEKVRKGISANLASPGEHSEALRGEDGEGIYFNDYFNWRRIPEFQEYVFQSPAAEIAGKLMNSKTAIFYHEHVLTKDPKTTKKTPWHQDQPYYPFNGFKVCSIWMPVDPVPKEASILFVKGSHKWGRWFIPTKFATEQQYKITQNEFDNHYEEVPNIDESYNSKIISWDLQPGDCIVFHMKTLHSAADNPSKCHQRRILSTRWFGDDVIFAPRPWETSPPISGGLQPFDPPYKSDLFPVIWKNN